LSNTVEYRNKCQIECDLRVIGHNLERECDAKQHGSQPSVLSKGIDKCSENRGHKGDSGHFGIMPYLDDLEIIGAESKCQSTNNGQPRIDPKCQHKKVKTDET